MTRRTVALSLAIAVVWVTPVVGHGGADTPPDASMRSVVVDDFVASEPAATGSRTRATTSTTWSTSAAIDAGAAVMVGADWGGDEQVAVQVRARDGDGWGEWVSLHAHDEHTPDGGSAEAARSTASEPVWVGRVDQLQFRTRGAVDDLEVGLVDMPGDLQYEPDTAGRGAAMAASEIPWIRPRAYWNAAPTEKVTYADDVRFSVVHHEGGTPAWTQEQIAGGCKESASRIKAIQTFHMNDQWGRGYWDIAYNFVVDPCGHIWEGRGGGMDRPVMGAHAGGWNSGSVGVLALGTFSDGNSDPVTDDMVRGIERLLSWKLDHHHTDPRGTTREVSGGGSSRYTEGTGVNVPILSAHQITNSTTCPGGVLMDRLFTGRNAAGTPKAEYVDHVYRAGLPKAFDAQPDRWVASEQGERPEWDVHFTEAVDWSLRITDEDGTLVRATGGLGETEAARTWDLRDAQGHLVDAGTYTAELTGTGPTGDITPVVTSLEVSPTVSRRKGADRVETSVALSRWAFDTAETAIVASAAAYPDALVSGPLAGSLDAPVLLTDHGDLPEGVEEEIERLGARQVYVIGGTVAVGDAVEAELNSDLDDVTVERIGGADRFATAAQVAQRVQAAAPSSEVLLSLGRHQDEDRAFPDALSAGAFGADLTLPVLLTDRDELPTATRQFLTASDPDTVTVFGGSVAISDQVESRVRSATSATVERFAGETRYDTSRMAAEDLLERRGVPAPDDAGDDAGDEDADATAPIDLLLASGGNWPDALGAGAAAAQMGATFLLVHPENLDDGAATRTFLDRWGDRIGAVSVAGGTVAVKSAVLTELAAYVTTGEGVDSEPIPWPADPNAPATESDPGESGPSESDASASPTPQDTATEQ